VSLDVSKTKHRELVLLAQIDARENLSVQSRKERNMKKEK
jgi:hypothetical protein